MNSLSTLFKLSSYVALVGWLILFFTPSWTYGLNIVLFIVVLLLCAIYSYLVFFAKKYDQGKPVRGSFWSLKGVISLFKSPRVVLAGWVHYLAFDLMIGLYIVTDAARFDISHWLLVPCLIITLMFGPAGLLLYFALRMVSEGEYGLFVQL